MVREKTIEKAVRTFIANELTMNPAAIQMDANLVNDLHADSMDIVNIVTAIESRFKIKFPDDSQMRYDGYTPQFLVDGVKKALQDKNPVRKAAKKVEEDVESKARLLKDKATSHPRKQTPEPPEVAATMPTDEPSSEA